jgi:hypothetical protein
MVLPNTPTEAAVLLYYRPVFWAGIVAAGFAALNILV